MRGRAISITRTGMALACWLAVAGAGHAQDNLGPRLDYTAALGCPPREDFEQRLRARMRGGASGSAALTVRLEAPGHASLRIREGDKLVGERSLTAASCSEAADALAFVAALLLEERAREQARREPAPLEPRRPTRATPLDARQREVRESAAHEREAREAEARERGEREAREAEARERGEREARARREREAEARARREREAEARERGPGALPAPAPRAPVDVWLAGGALLATGVTPAARPGLEVEAGLAVQRRLAYGAVLGARAALPRNVRSDEGDARLRWASATLALCAGPRLHAVHLAGCIDTELGRIRGEGRATEAATPRNSAWYALGPSLRARLPVWGKLSLAAGLALPVPLTRDRFVVGTVQLHRVPSITFRASLALALEFE